MSRCVTLARSMHPVEDWSVTGTQREGGVRSMRRAGVAMAMLLAASAPGAHAQAAGGTGTEAYFGAVAEYFVLPRSEVAILSEWSLPAEEIPVVLFGDEARRLRETIPLSADVPCFEKPYAVDEVMTTIQSL